MGFDAWPHISTVRNEAQTSPHPRGMFFAEAGRAPPRERGGGLAAELRAVQAFGWGLWVGGLGLRLGRVGFCGGLSGGALFEVGGGGEEVGGEGACGVVKWLKRLLAPFGRLFSWCVGCLGLIQCLRSIYNLIARQLLF